jgi:4'-phosphopantetheinyl transferase
MLTLNSGDVHIWTARLPLGNTSEFYLDVSSAERDHADRFHFSKDRVAYLFAHAVLRNVLSQYLRCPPGDLEFDVNAFGKPFLGKTAGAGKLEFNLSHAGSLIVIGLSANRSIGVDVEELHIVSDFSLIAESYFTPEECRFVFQQASSDQEWAFFRCWTRKEAYIKAIGQGLSIPLNSFDTLIPYGQAGRLLVGAADIPGDGKWWLEDLDLPKPYIGAVAVQNRTDRMMYFEWCRDEER